MLRSSQLQDDGTRRKASRGGWATPIAIRLEFLLGLSACCQANESEDTDANEDEQSRHHGRKPLQLADDGCLKIGASSDPGRGWCLSLKSLLRRALAYSEVK